MCTSTTRPLTWLHFDVLLYKGIVCYVFVSVLPVIIWYLYAFRVASDDPLTLSRYSYLKCAQFSIRDWNEKRKWGKKGKHVAGVKNVAKRLIWDNRNVNVTWQLQTKRKRAARIACTWYRKRQLNWRLWLLSRTNVQTDNKSIVAHPRRNRVRQESFSLENNSKVWQDQTLAMLLVPLRKPPLLHKRMLENASEQIFYFYAIKKKKRKEGQLLEFDTRTGIIKCNFASLRVVVLKNHVFWTVHVVVVVIFNG